MAEALEAGTAYLNLLAGASGLQQDVAKKVKKVSAPDIIAKIDGQIAGLEAKVAKAREKLQELGRAAEDPQVGLDISELEARAALVRQKLDDLRKLDASPKVTADIAAAEAQLGRINAKLQALEQKQTNARVGAEMAELEAKVAKARQQLDELGRQETSPKVEADTYAAQAKLDALTSRLDALRYENPTARVDANTERAVAQIRALEAQITRLNGQKASVKVDADGGAVAQAQLNAVDQKRRQVDGSNASVNIAASGGAQASGILGAIVAGVSAVAAVSPAAASALSVVLNMGTGAAQAAGAAVAGFSGISDSIKAVEADEKTAATSSSGAAATRVNSARQIASAQAAVAAAVTQADRAAITGAQQVADARRALASAVANASRTAVDGARQVAAAEAAVGRAREQADRTAVAGARAVSDARRALADAVVSAADRISSAERSVGVAQESVRFAQEALTRARRDAAEANEDLQLSLSGIALSERRAVLAQKKAQAALAKGGSTALEQEELQLNVDEAEQNLKEVRERYGDLRAEQAQFAATGIAGTDSVTAAQRRLTDAQRGAGDAARALTAAQVAGAREVDDAQRALSAAQVSAAESNRDAQRAVTAAVEESAQAQERAAAANSAAQEQVADAARSLGRAQQQAGWAQQDAARGVADAQRGLQDALASTAQAAGAAGAAGKQSAYQLAKLTPAGREFVDFWTKAWKPAYEDVTNAVAGSLLPRIQTAMHQLLGLQPVFKKGLADTGAVLGDLAVKGSNLMTSGAFRRDFGVIMDSNNRSLRSWGQAGLYGVDAARALTVAGLPLSERLARTAESAMRGVDSFILQKEASGELGRFMQFAGEKAGQLFGVTMDLVGGAYQLAVAIAPVGSVVLDLVGGLGQLVGEFAQAHPLMVQIGAAGLIVGAGLNTAAKAAVALRASALMSLSGLTMLAGGLKTAVSPNAVYASAAMSRFHLAARSAGASAAGAVYGLTGSAAAASKTAGAVGGAATALGRIGSALPVIGLALIATGAAWDGLTTSTSEAVDKLTSGKASFAELSRDISWQTALVEGARMAWGPWGDALSKVAPGIREVSAEFAEQMKTMSQLEQMQVLSKMSLKNYEDALLKFGAGSREAAAAQATYKNSVKNVEIAQIAVREGVDSATAAMLYQRDQILAGLDANLRARLAARQLGKDQEALAKAIGAYGAGSQQAIDAGLQLEQSQLRQAEAAKSSAGGQQAFVQSIRDMVATSKGEFTPTLAGMVQSLTNAELSAAGAQVKFDAAGRAVATFPGGKTVVLDANTSPVYPALAAVKLAVDSTKGTVGVDADPTAGVATVGGFKLATDATRGVVTVDGNITPAEQQRLGIKAKTDGTTGVMFINGNPVPCDGALNGARFRVDQTTGVMTVDGNPAPADAASRGAHDRANLPAGFDIHGNPIPADAASRGAHDRARVPQVFGLSANPDYQGLTGFFNWLNDAIRGAGNTFANIFGTGPGSVYASTQRALGRADGGLVQAYAAGGRVQGFPTGGGVRGPGGPTADRIPAMLSDGEYVIRAAAVRKVGVPALNAINGLRDGGPVLPLNFAAGGTVDTPAAAGATPSVDVDTAAAAAASASTDAMAGSLGAAAVAAGMLNPALAALALTQSSLLVPAQAAVTLGQQAMAAAVWTTLAPALGVYQQKVGVEAPLANQALQVSQLNTRLSTDQTALNTGLNSTAMSTSIAAMSLAAQLQHQGLRAGQFATRLDTDQTRLNAQLNNSAMTLSTQGMSLQAQLQHQLLRAGQLATQQHTTLTAQNTAANNTNMIATTQGMSAQNQGHLLNLRNAQGVTSQATTAFADAWRAQLGRTIPDSGNPLKWVINFPIRSITDAWNHLDAQFALGKRVPPYVPNFATGGVMPGYTPGHDVRTARVSGGEAIMRPEWTRTVGSGYVAEANRAARSGGERGVAAFLNSTQATSPRVEGDAKLRLMRRYALDNGAGRFAYGGVVPHVAAAGAEVERTFGRMPGGIGGKGSRGNASDHPSGHALDFMTLGNMGLGDRVNAHLNANRGRLQVKYLIWKQRIDGQPMEDRGSATANHMDHVHASFKGGPLGDGGGGPAFDPTPIVEAAFAKAYREIADVPKFFGPSVQVGRDQGVARFSADKVKAKALEKVMATVGAMGLAPGGTGPVRAQVQATANRHGFGAGAQWGALDRLIQKESSWNPLAQNPSSTAFGLFQFLNSTWGTVGGRKTSNPGEQAEYGLRYIKQRYRDPVGALNFHNCVTMDTVILTRGGWKRHDEVSVGDETLGYNADTGRNEWTRISAVHHYGDAPLVTMGNARWSVRCTPNHRWRVENRQSGRDYGFKATQDLNGNHRIRVSALAETDGNDRLSIDDAALLGWILTDGHIEGDPRVPSTKRVHLQASIYQSKPQHLPELERLLRDVPHGHSVRQRVEHYLPAHTFRLSTAYTRELLLRSGLYDGDGAPDFDGFVLALNDKQRAAFMDAVKAAEGTPVTYKGNDLWRIPQVSGAKCDALVLAAYLEGHKPMVNPWREGKSPYNAQPCSMITLGMPTVGVQSLTIEDAGTETVWCVTTDLGSWTAKQGGQMFLTGNSNNWYDDGGLANGKGLMVKNTAAPERVLSPVQTQQYDTIGTLMGRNGIRVEGLDQAVNDGGTQPLVGDVHYNYYGDQGRGDMTDLAHTLRRARVASGG